MYDFLAKARGLSQNVQSQYLTESAGADQNDLIALCESYALNEQHAAMNRFEQLTEVMLNETATAEDKILLNEGFMASARTKIKEIFDKIVKIIKGIIEKIKQFKDGFMRNADLYLSRYEGKIRDKNLSKFSIQGYEFDAALIKGLNLPDVESFVEGQLKAKSISVTPSGIHAELEKALSGLTNQDLVDKVKELSEKYIAPIKEMATDERGEMAESYAKSAISGFASSKEKFRDELAKSFYGGTAKKEIKMTADDIIGGIKNKAAIDDIQKDYDDLSRKVEKAGDVLGKVKESYDKGYRENSDKGTPGASKAYQMASEFVDAYVALYQAVLRIALTVNGERLNAAKAMNSQALDAAKKAVTYKAESASVEITEADFAELDEETIVDAMMA